MSDIIEAQELWEFDCPNCQKKNRIFPYPGMVDAYPLQIACEECGSVLYIRPVLAQRPEFKRDEAERGHHGKTGN